VIPLSFIRLRELLRKEMRQMFRDPRMKRVVFIAPVVQLIVFGYAVNTDIRDTQTFVVDLDRSPASRELIDTFQSSGYFEIVGNSRRPPDLVYALDHGVALVGIEISAGFERDLSSGRGAHIQVILDGTSSNTATIAHGYAQRIVQRFAHTHQPDSSNPDVGGGIDLRTRAWYNPELESRVYNVPGVIGVLLLIMCLLLTALAVVRERELGTLDQLMVSPLTASELILGKTLPVTLVGMIDLTLISVLAVLWFGIPMRGSIVALVLAAVLYIVAGLSVGLLISTVSKTQQEAFMTMFLFAVPSIILSGFFYPIDSMPDLFQWITVLNPLRHFLEIVRAIFLKGSGVVDLWRQYSATTALAAGVFGLAVARFKRTLNS
jgi:ABC-2 type transport system permease protein